MEKSELEQLVNDNWDKLPKDLDNYGLNSPRENANDRLNRNTIIAVVGFIKDNFKKIKSFNTNRTSYGIKHDVERVYREKHTAFYIANGELIASMILAGFKYKKEDEKSPNCYFNVSQTSFE